MNKEYGRFIKNHRMLSGFKSQRQLAEASGVSPTTISRIEKEEQKPSVDTLKELAPHLKSTSIVELMVVCGYWEDDELLEPIEYPVGKELVGEYINNIKGDSVDIQKTPSEEEVFIKNIDLSNEDLMKQFKLEIDGKELSEEESEMLISYVRFLRTKK